MALAAGTRLGSYEIASLIGAGGMGEVYRAHDSKLGRDVAIKVLPVDVGTRPDALARFEREARAVAALSHPGILAIHDFGTSDGVSYAVMELLEGESMRQAVADGPLPPRRAVDYAVQIARALAAAHDKGIVHRDIKPENVFVTAEGQVKVLDFGLARQEAPATAATQGPTQASPTGPGIIMGTVGYMAPEQVRGAPVDLRADIFAFGALLYEMLTGRRAFARETATETMTAILRDDVPEMAAGGIPPAIERIVRRCLEKKPEARFRSAHDLAFALESTSGISSGSTPVPQVAPPSTGSARSRAVLAAATTGLLLAVAGGVWFGREGGAAAEPPRFQQITFDDATVRSARFAPDGQTVVYSMQQGDSEPRLLLTRLDSSGVTPLALQNAQLLAISRDAEMLVVLKPQFRGFGVEGTLVRLALLGGAPREVLDHVTHADWSPAGDAIAAVRVVGSQNRLEYPLGQVLVTTEGEIGEPRVSPSGDLLAFFAWPVKDDDRGSVVIVDREGRQQTIAGPHEAVRGLAWTPDGKEVWFGAATAGSNYELRAAGAGRPERRLYTVPPGLLLYDIARDGRALVGLYDRTIRVEVTTEGEARPRDLSWHNGSIVRDISRDGRTVLLSYFGQGSSANYDVYVRGVDAPEAVKIGEGQPQQFSPDGRSVLTVVHGPPSRVVVQPIGPGEARTVPTGPILVTDARWLPDGQRLLIVGTEPPARARAYVTDIAGSPAKAITPEGVTFAANQLAVANDGSRVAFQSPAGAVMLYSTAGDAPLPVAGLGPGEIPVGWTSDDRGLLIRDTQAQHRLVAVDRTSGRRTTIHEFVQSNPSLVGPGAIVWTPDGRTYAATWQRRAMTVYVVEGLR